MVFEGLGPGSTFGRWRPTPSLAASSRPDNSTAILRSGAPGASRYSIQGKAVSLGLATGFQDSATGGASVAQDRLAGVTLCKAGGTRFQNLAQPTRDGAVARSVLGERGGRLRRASRILARRGAGSPSPLRSSCWSRLKRARGRPPKTSARKARQGQTAGAIVLFESQDEPGRRISRTSAEKTVAEKTVAGAATRPAGG